MNAATISFKTVGCRLNQAETAVMRAAFKAAGYSEAPFGARSDVCVVHSCAVTAGAERDSLRAARAARRLNPRGFVVLAGCLAEIGGEDARAACGADIAAGQAGKFRLPEMLARRGICPQGAPGGPTGSPLPCFETTRAFVKIQDGCDFFCAYCVVPHARGLPRSRPLEDIVGEAGRLGETGFREVVLTGANIGCYSDGGRKLTDLLESLEALPAVERIRVSSIEVSTIERAVVDFMSGSSKLCRSLHLPLQSGDDGILRSMGRRYTARQYRELAEYAVERLGSFGLGTDILVGFPGEDERAFAATERLVRELPFNNLHVFSYSRRPGTRAADINAQVPEAVKKQRAARIREAGCQKRTSFAASRVGSEASVLIESVDAAGRGAGWTGEYLKARVCGGKCAVNRIVRFVPDRVDGDTLIGSLENSGQ